MCGDGNQSILQEKDLGVSLNDAAMCPVIHALTCTCFLMEGYFLGNFFSLFFGIFSRFLVEGRCEEGRKDSHHGTQP